MYGGNKKYYGATTQDTERLLGETKMNPFASAKEDAQRISSVTSARIAMMLIVVAVTSFTLGRLTGICDGRI